MTRTPDVPPDPVIAARKQAAGRFGFRLGIFAAVFAAVLNLWRTPQPLEPLWIVTLLLIAALNIPLGIAMALLGERITRRRGGGGTGPTAR